MAVAGCNTPFAKNESIPLARANGEYLYISDIQDDIPDNLNPRDSIEFVRSYVNDWIKTNVMIYQAEKNLPDDQMDFSRQLDNYRNSLIIYQYETNLINQKLDTIVSDEDIEEYYYNNQADFELKENITKALYIITDNDTETESLFDYLFSLPDSVKFDSIFYYSNANSIVSNTDTSKWVSFIDIQKKIPIETYNRELFLKNNRFIKIESDKIIYYLEIIDYLIKDDISPLEFKVNDIKNIILSKRKIKLARKVRDDIYRKALANKEFEIYQSGIEN